MCSVPPSGPMMAASPSRSEEHTSELQSHDNLVCRLLLEKKKKRNKRNRAHTTVLRVSVECERARDTHHCVLLSHVQRLLFTTCSRALFFFFFFFNDPATPEIYPFPLPDALPI